MSTQAPETRTTRNSHFRHKIGPGVFVTAAFIGPGTVLAASTAGADFGYSLLWAIVFSIVAAVILQEMAARLGIVTGKGLAEAIHCSFGNPFLRWAMISLVLGAILFGNSAYQTGNILGAASGLQILTAGSDSIWSLVIAATALTVIAIGRFELLQWLLITLVGLMGVIFFVSAISCGPELTAILKGLKPAIPGGSGWIIVGLIGTTVVPYNLFLHASGAAERFAHFEDKRSAIRDSFVDLAISIAIGGVITASLLITAAVTFTDTGLNSIADIADQLRPTLGAWAEHSFAVGLFAAGLTSSITAPIAAAYAASGCFGWRAELSDPKFKIVAATVILIGLTAALSFGGSPQQTIIIAQIANGLLLPIVAVFLLYTMNRKDLVGEYGNGFVANLLGTAVVVVTCLIAARQFRSVWHQISILLENGN